jgi:amino acid permease
MKEGSVRGSIFTICSIAIGIGILTLPYVIASLGWILGSAMVIMGGLTTTWSLKIIVKLANHQ